MRPINNKIQCAYYLLPLALCLFLFSCGGSGLESSGSGSLNSGTGTIVFDLEWQHSSQASISPVENRSGQGATIRAGSDCCVDYGISTVNAKVFNSSNVQIGSGDWPCSAHQGTLTGVPVGSNHWIRLEGTVSGGGVNWRGEKTGINVVAGSSANAGTITMAYIGSDRSLPIVSSPSPSNNSTNVPVTSAITATFSKAMASSCINTATFSLKRGTTTVNGSVSYSSSAKTASFMPSSNLDYNTSYTAAITTDVEDMAGNHMGANYEWSFTTESLPTGPPSAVPGMTATGGDGQVIISWSSVSGATSYNLYWSTTSGVTKATGTRISNVTSPYTHTGLTNGASYYYVVTGVNILGESGESSEASATPGTVPSAPTGVGAAAGDGQVSISWNVVSGATTYNIYWSATSGVNKATGTKISNVTSPYTHTGLTNGTTYYYVVTAVNSTGESGVSSQVSGTPVSSVDRWVPTGALIQGRFKHSSTLLPTGKVLIAGGMSNLQSNNEGDYFNTAELYDPTSGKFSSTANMNNRRGWHWGEGPAVALLNNGDVLLAGGWDDTNGSTQSGGIIDQRSAELYNPSTGNFTYTTGSMISPSSVCRAVLMHDGRVLIVGNTAMIYDPISAVFSPISGGIIYLRFEHTATLLPNGKVLIAGGNPPGVAPLNTAELFDPAKGTFSETENVKSGRSAHQATLLPSGKVLITGGFSGTNGVLDTAEIYDPATGAFSVIGRMNYPRAQHTATLLPNGKVLIAGGLPGYGGDIGVCEIYDPLTAQFTIGSSMISPRHIFLATKLADGSVLVTGGSGEPRASELFIPSPPSDTTPPSNPSVVINNGAVKTTSSNVTLTLSAADDTGVFAYYASESSAGPLAFLSTWMPIATGATYSGAVPFTLSPGAGLKTVYVWFRDVAGNMSAVRSASITLE